MSDDDAWRNMIFVGAVALMIGFTVGLILGNRSGVQFGEELGQLACEIASDLDREVMP